jgi:hypothetical protein
MLLRYGWSSLKVLALGEMWSAFTPNGLEARTSVGVKLLCFVFGYFDNSNPKRQTTDFSVSQLRSSGSVFRSSSDIYRLYSLAFKVKTETYFA